jgi:hypothetical protein
VLAEHTSAIRALLTRTVKDVAEIGRRLTEVRKIVGHGNWLPWLDREFGWTDQTARNFMRIHELAANSKTVLDLAVPISTLYTLAAPSTSEEVRAAALKRAAAGEMVSAHEVRRLNAVFDGLDTPSEIEDWKRIAAMPDEGSGRGIVTGVAMHPYSERGYDLYQTPAPATRALLEAESFDDGTIWECAAGKGAIATVLRADGHRVVATDLVDYGVEGVQGGVDFLKQRAAPKGVTTVLTNPPFMHADEFARHALTLVPRVAFLLRLAFVASVGRADILDGGKLARIHVFANRLSFHRDGWDGSRDGGNAIEFAWFIWDREHRGPIELRRISWKAEAPSEAAAVECVR